MRICTKTDEEKDRGRRRRRRKEGKGKEDLTSRNKRGMEKEIVEKN